MVNTLVPLIFVCLHSLCVHTIGQIGGTPERKLPVSPSLVTAQDPLSTSKTELSAREMRIRALAGRIAAAGSETEADALLQTESDLAGVELGRALLAEILRLRNTTIPRDNILKASLRLLRYTERPDMTAARGMAQRGLGVAYANLEKWDLAEQHLSTAISLFVPPYAALNFGKTFLDSRPRPLAGLHMPESVSERWVLFCSFLGAFGRSRVPDFDRFRW